MNQNQQEPQGEGIEVQYLLESYMSTTMNLTKENAMLRALLAQQKKQIEALKSEGQKEEKELPPTK